MDFKVMKDSELANVMINYIARVENLMDIIGRYLDGKDCISADQIRKEYASLKKELREDAHYLGLQKNNSGSMLYMGEFAPSIIEADRWGFGASVNSAVDQKMYNAVSEAYYKLTKYNSFEEWGSLL